MDKENFKKEFIEICKELTYLLDQNYQPDAQKVQDIVYKHYLWSNNFWTPTRESYAGHGCFIVDSELRKAYEIYHSQLPEFIADAIQIFAKKMR